MTKKISDGFSRIMGTALLLGTLSIGAAAGSVIYNQVTYNQLERTRSQVPKECSGHAVKFRGRIYAPPIEQGRARSLGDGITYVSAPRGRGYIHIAKELGYPDPECFGNAMKNYNELHGVKNGLKRGDVVLIPEMPPRTENQRRSLE